MSLYHSMSLWELLMSGGPVMVPIFMCSVAGCAVFFERLWVLQRMQIDRDKFVKGIRNIIRKTKIAEAVSICEQTPGPVAAVIKAGLINNGKERAQVREAMEGAALFEIPKMRRHLMVLGTIAQITPLLGLLGAMTGMINAFMVIHQRGGFVNASDLSRGVYESLITMVAGLLVSIPAVAAYNYLLSSVRRLVTDLELATIEILDTLDTAETDYEAR